jgi:hypothetical protein
MSNKKLLKINMIYFLRLFLFIIKLTIKNCFRCESIFNNFLVRIQNCFAILNSFKKIEIYLAYKSYTNLVL